MIHVASIDAESYYDKEISIKTLGTWHYLRATDIYLISIVTTDGFEWVGHPKDAPWERIRNHIWVSHNRSFDAQVYYRLQELKHAPVWVPTQWHCTADMCAYLGAPRSLAGGSQELLGITVEKDVRDKMSGKKWEQMTETFKAEVSEYALNDSRRCLQLWVEHSAKYPEWERQLSQLTFEMALVGVEVDQELVQQYLGSLKRLIWEANRAIPWAGNHPSLSPKQLATYCRSVNIPPPASLAMDSQECAVWEDKYGDDYPVVSAMRQVRRANMLLKKFEVLHRRVRPDGRASLPLKYCGASTRRWSGDAGFNAQNLTRDEVLGTEARKTLVAAPGMKFIACDLSQIEPRVLAILSKDTDTLAMLQQYDVYEAHARSTMGFNRPETLKALGGIPEFETMRRLAKARVLGLGYGCGPDKFVVVAKTLAGLIVSLPESKRIVDEYRKQNPKIIGLWRKLQRALERSVGDDLILELPSGNSLVYKKVACKDGEYTALVSKNGRMCRVKLYGGLLTENLTQSVARDVFSTGLLRLREQRHRIVLQTHDEAVVEVPIDFDKQIIIDAMTVPPPWMPNIPLQAEAVEGPHYAI